MMMAGMNLRCHAGDLLLALLLSFTFSLASLIACYLFAGSILLYCSSRRFEPTMKIFRRPPPSTRVTAGRHRRQRLGHGSRLNR